MKKHFLILIMPFNVTASFISKIAPEYKAYAAYEDKNFAVAETVYAQNLEQDPYSAVMNYNLGTTLYKQKKFAEAKNHFKRSVEKLSNENDLLLEHSLFNLGNSFMQLAEYQFAIDSYEKVLKLNVNNEHAQKNLELARALLEEQKRKEEEQKKQDQQKNDQDKQDQDKNQQSDQGKNDQQKDQQGKENKDNSGKSENAESQDQKDAGQQNEKDDDSNGRQQKNQQSKSESSDSDKEKKDQNVDKNKPGQEDRQQDKSGSDENQGLEKQQKNQGEEQNERLQKPKEEQKLAKESGQEKEKQDSGAEQGLEAEQSKNELQDQYADQMRGGLVPDERLNKHEAMLLKALSDQENSIQKQLLRMNVSKEGGKHEKNW